MSTKGYQKGDVITYTNTGSAIASGDVVVIGSIIGVAEKAIAATTGTGPVRIAGIVTLAAENGTGKSWTAGSQLYWNSSSAYLCDDSTGNTKAGIAPYAKGASATTGQVKLNVNVA